MLTTVITVCQVILVVVLGSIVLRCVVVLVAIVIGASVSAYTSWRDIRFLSGFACPKCEGVIGRAAGRAARDHYDRKQHEALKQHSGFWSYGKLYWLRLAEPEWEIVHPNCGFKFVCHAGSSTVEIPMAPHPDTRRV